MSTNTNILSEKTVKLDYPAKSKEDAIKAAGQLLVDQGYVKDSYIEKMLERENSLSTYMGNYVAIPHGTDDSKNYVMQSGISVLQIPDGVDFGDGNIAKLVIGIAGKNNEHLEILSKIAIVCSEEENVEKIVQAQSVDELLSYFEEVE